MFIAKIKIRESPPPKKKIRNNNPMNNITSGQSAIGRKGTQLLQLQLLRFSVSHT